MSMKTNHLLCSLSLIAALSAFAADPVNLMPEGEFSSSDSVVVAPEKSVGAWTLNPGDYSAKGISYNFDAEEGMNFLQLKTTEADGTFTWIEGSAELPDPAPEQVRVSFRVRTNEMELADTAGPEWFSAQVQVRTHTASGDESSLNIVYRGKESTSDWTEVEQAVLIPAGSTKVNVQAGFWGYKGTFEIADFKIIPE